MSISANLNGWEKPRAPDVYGHISSDEIWSGEIYFDDVTIDEDVTVTIKAGTILR